MKSTVWRALLGLAVALLITPAMLRAEGTSPVLSDLYSASSFGGAHSFVQVDDLVTMNAEGTGRRGGSVDDTNSSSETTVDSAATPDTLEALPSADEGHWILGAFGAVFVMGLGITFAGIYWSGPLGFTRMRNRW